MRCCGHIARVQEMACCGGNTCCSVDCHPHYITYQTHNSCSSTIGRTIGNGYPIPYCRRRRPTLYPLIPIGTHLCSFCILHRIGYLLSEDMAENTFPYPCHNGRILTHISVATLHRGRTRRCYHRNFFGLHRIPRPTQIHNTHDLINKRNRIVITKNYSLT